MPCPPLPLRLIMHIIVALKRGCLCRKRVVPHFCWLYPARQPREGIDRGCRLVATELLSFNEITFDDPV
jgi:hypothetical protein